MDRVKFAAGIVLIAAVLVAVATYEIAAWGECVRDHPWWYCLRILSK